MMRAKWIALSMLLAGCASQTNATDDATMIAWLTADATTRDAGATTSTTSTTTSSATTGDAAVTCMYTWTNTVTATAWTTLPTLSVTTGCEPAICASYSQISQMTFTGSIAFADTDVSSLTMSFSVLEWTDTLACDVNTGADAGIDADVATYWVDDSGVDHVPVSDCPITKTGPGQYAVQYSMSKYPLWNTPCTLSFTVTSGGTTLFSETPAAVCNEGCQPCGGSFLDTCTATL
jgi:hypothetical protein